MKSQLISTSLLAATAFAPLAAAVNHHHARDGWDTPGHWHHHPPPPPPSASSDGAASGASQSVTTLLTSTVKTVVATTVVQAPSSTEAASSQAPASSAAASSSEVVVSSAVTSAAEETTLTSSSVEVNAADAATTAASSAASASSTGTVSLSRKSGLSGYVGIANTQAFQDLSPYLSWYSDYTPTTQNVGDVKGVGMLWGNGQTCTSNTDDSTRMSLFKSDVATNSTPPEIMFGFYEPDCYCPMSSDMSTSDGTTVWNSLIAPLKDKGTILGSPSMCKQKDEDWLTPFSTGSDGSSLLDADWDVTSVHINKNSIDGVKEDVEYYLSTYKKPLWISEFACVDDQNDFTACTDQDAINQFISDAVDYFHANESVVAYGPSNGEGLGTVWPLTDSSTGELSATGQAYLSKIKSL